LKDAFIPATLISIEPENAVLAGESYSIEVRNSDRFITRKSLEDALKNADKNWLQALIIRTLPNDDNKLGRTYKEEIPPFFSTDAIQFIVELGVKHLLVDLPSIDRIFDEGKLSNHRIFWNIGQDEFEINSASLVNNTITELIFVPEIVADGSYLLNLQTAAFVADAAPSRPILFKVFE
jgi:kynurenine formamidase